MRVLLDECVDPKVSKLFSEGFQVSHLRDLGWLGTKNGILVQKANDSFEVLFTIDSNMRHQTSLKNLTLIVVVAEGHFRSLEDYSKSIQQFEASAIGLERGKYHLVSQS